MKKIFTLVIAIVVVAFTLQAQNTWTQKADFSGTARMFAVGFSIDNKGYIGTGSDNNGDKNDFWEYDPATNAWTQKANFGGTARNTAVGFSIGSKGYIGTGSSGFNIYTDFWEYDPAVNAWSQKANVGGSKRLEAIGFSIGNKGYIGSGWSGTTQINDFWEYDPSTDTWTQKANTGGTIRNSAVGFSIGSKGYIGAGWDGGYKNDFWEYDPSTDTWTQKANFGGTARRDAVGFSIGNKGYIGTGDDGSFDYKNDFWEYDVDENAWIQKADFGGIGRYHAIGFSIENKGYIGTGYGDSYEKDFWEYTPDNTCITPTATITPLGNLDICETGFVKLQASSGDNYTYQWNRNNVYVPGATNQIFKARKTGNYRVRIASDKGCNAVSKKTVVTSSCKLVDEEELNSSLSLFPNPTTGTFTLDLKLNDEENSQAIIQVLNMLGQVVYEETTSVANGVLQKEIQLSDAAAEEMYLVKVTIKDCLYLSQINLQK